MKGDRMHLALTTAPILAAVYLYATAPPPQPERCSPDPLEAFDDAWRRWGVEGLPMRDCDAAALLRVRELAQQQLEGGVDL